MYSAEEFLVRERTYPSRSRMTFSRSEVDEATFAEDVDLATIFGGVLIDERANGWVRQHSWLPMKGC